MATTAKEKAKLGAEEDWVAAKEQTLHARDACHHLNELYKEYQNNLTSYYEGNTLYLKRTEHNRDFIEAEAMEKYWASEVGKYSAGRKLS